MTQDWELDARWPEDYHKVECQRGREFIIRMTTGTDVFLALQKFAKDHDIKFAKIHACFMGGLQPAKYLVWAPDTVDPDNWHREPTTRARSRRVAEGTVTPREQGWIAMQERFGGQRSFDWGPEEREGAVGPYPAFGPLGTTGEGS